MGLEKDVSKGGDESARLLTFVLGPCYGVPVLQAHCKDTAACPFSGPEVIVDNRGTRLSQGPGLLLLAERWMLTACRALPSSGALATILKAIRRSMHQGLFHILYYSRRSVDQADLPTVEGEREHEEVRVRRGRGGGKDMTGRLEGPRGVHGAEVRVALGSKDFEQLRDHPPGPARKARVNGRVRAQIQGRNRKRT